MMRNISVFIMAHIVQKWQIGGAHDDKLRIMANIALIHRLIAAQMDVQGAKGGA